MKKKIFLATTFFLIIVSLFTYYKSTLKIKETFKEQENIFLKKQYYLPQNLDRYIHYYSTHPEVSIEDIIAIVNVNKDKRPYQDIKKANINKGILTLINKYNYLDENYAPKDMIIIDPAYAYAQKQTLKEVNEAFINMYNDALKDGISFYVVSAYRSYNYQKQLYAKYLINYGEIYTEDISARPGYSEHQSGLALDILSEKVPMAKFQITKAYKWLKKNSYKYGFILRYPEGKSYLTCYNFEPWHYRYIGVKDAQKVYEENLTFDEYYAYYLDN